MASLSYYQGGFWTDFPFEKEARRPKIKIVHATSTLVKFTLTNTDVSVANSLRRVILAEVPTMAVETVNVEENDSVIFDEFLAHRMGLLPLTSEGVGDIPPDAHFGFREHKDCNCFDGCPYCTVEFNLDVTNTEDRVLNVTHFDLTEAGTFDRELAAESHRVLPIPFRREGTDHDIESRDHGILICKLKKDQRLKMVCQARKGIPKYHSKFMPVATCCMRYQPIVKLDDAVMNELTLEQKVEFVDACPRKVFVVDDQTVKIDKLQDCIFCDECVAKAKEWGKKDAVIIQHDTDTFHFIVESVTPDGPRSVIDVVRAAIRVLDYKLAMFLNETWGDEITDWLPYESPFAK